MRRGLATQRNEPGRITPPAAAPGTVPVGRSGERTPKSAPEGSKLRPHGAEGLSRFHLSHCFFGGANRDRTGDLYNAILPRHVEAREMNKQS